MVDRLIVIGKIRITVSSGYLIFFFESWNDRVIIRIICEKSSSILTEDVGQRSWDRRTFSLERVVRLGDSRKNMGLL